MVGLRFPTNRDFDNALKALEDICGDNADERIHAEMETKGVFRAMEPVPGTEKLLSLYQDTCEQLGYTRPAPVYTGGCSDAAFVTMQGDPGALRRRSQRQRQPLDQRTGCCILPDRAGSKNRVYYFIYGG